MVADLVQFFCSDHRAFSDQEKSEPTGAPIGNKPRPPRKTGQRAIPGPGPGST